jgi:hypothetical protein
MMSLGLLLLDHQVHGQTNQTESVGSVGRLTGGQAQISALKSSCPEAFTGT